MSADPSPAESALTLADWRHFDALLDEVAELTRSQLSPPEFLDQVLDRTVRALSAVGGAVWIPDATRGWVACASMDLAQVPWGQAGADPRQHAALLDHVASQGAPLSLAPRWIGGGQPAVVNPSPFLLLIVPIVVDDAASAVVEVWQRPGGGPAAEQGYERLLAAVCDLAADYFRAQQVRELQAAAASRARFERFIASIHESLDLNRVAYAIANEGRQVIGCDRLAVAVTRGRRARLQAVSGVDTIQRRSTAVRRLEQLIAAVLVGQEPLWYPHDADDLPPQIEQALQAYLDASHAQSVAIVPLVPAADDAQPGQRHETALGALVVENFTTASVPEPARRQAAAVARHSTLALANALTLRAIPFAWFWRSLAAAPLLFVGRRLPKTLLALAAVGGLAAALALVPMDFDVEARGELLPERRRDVFAPSDGVVSELRVEHGEQVQAGDVLAVMTRPQLDFEFSRVTGEMQTARKRLSALQAARLGRAPTDSQGRDQFQQRTADEEEVKELLKSLAAQLAVLEQQAAELTVRSPIAGQVLTWDVERQIESRPLQRGQVLLGVGDLEGPWLLELRVPDDRIGYVLAAQETHGAALDATFMLATDPETTYAAVLRDVALATDTTDAAGPTVLVKATLAGDRLPRLRPGASVVAKIHCGRRSAGFVLLHDLWDALQTRVWF